MAKKTKVTLQIAKSEKNVGKKKDFDFEHAERMIKSGKRVWVLPKDSPFELTQDGLKRKSNK